MRAFNSGLDTDSCITTKYLDKYLATHLLMHMAVSKKKMVLLGKSSFTQLSKSVVLMIPTTLKNIVFPNVKRACDQVISCRLG